MYLNKEQMMIPTTEVNGTCLQGYLDITYEELTNIFGEPHVKRTAPLDTQFDSKTDIEWHFIEERNGTDNVVFTIYNWKNGPAYTGQGEVETITRWNVGGHNANAFDVVKRYVSNPFKWLSI